MWLIRSISEAAKKTCTEDASPRTPGNVKAAPSPTAGHEADGRAPYCALLTLGGVELLILML